MSFTVYRRRRRNAARQFLDREGHAACARTPQQRAGASTNAHQRSAAAVAAVPARQSGAQRRRAASGGGARLADGIILGSPGYHGSISGLVKNALDYAEICAPMRGLISAAARSAASRPRRGWPGAVNTLGALRDIVHALRGWPTPLGAAINSTENVFDEQGRCLVPRIGQILDLMAEEVMSFARAVAPR